MIAPVSPEPKAEITDERVRDVVNRVWGFDTLRPLQEEAIQAGLDGRDSLVVLPTGGGKSLCYQVPALVAERTDVVVSPLISLMKDQVDGLRQNGVEAVAIHSGLTSRERRQSEALMESGQCRLAFVAPERLVMPWFLDRLEAIGVRSFAIDEAHCVSHWGHDFRPEYRQLAQLKDRFPEASVHAFTATATERVRDDVIASLGLDDPAVLVGTFDRPNLVYRLVSRGDVRRQVEEVIGRHANQAVIVYAISRADTERLAAHLASKGVRAAAYHAGLDNGTRREVQEAFSSDQIDVVVATVAFGMGIDRSDVRAVLHAALPKSIEHYQQETGRAGRDGLEAECVLFHSPADVLKWKGLIERGGNGYGPGTGTGTDEPLAELLEEMRRYCTPGRCRHRALSEYFGQAYERENCGACDTCLGESEDLEDRTVEAQKIMSTIARVGQRFGAGHVVDVVRGADSERVRSLGHDTLTTHGLLADLPKTAVTNMVYQLIDQELIHRTDGDYPILMLNERSWEVLRGEREVAMLPTKRTKKRAKKTAIEKESWEGVDRELFEELRTLRTEIARERGVPPYVIFGDASLRDMARQRPSTPEEFLAVHGVGEKKLADLGETFLAAINSPA